MNDISFDEDGYPRVYTIHSQKGGVGKTSIALALAGISGAKGKKTLIIDGDMTGASIADVPGLKCELGSNFNKLILAKPNEFLRLTSIWPPLKYDKSSDLELKFCRKMADHESVYFIPSSAGAADVEAIVPLIAQEDHLHFFRHRIEDILAAAIQSGFETIILDHSPGLFGFSKTALQMCLEWGLRQDKNDHRLGHLLKGQWEELTLQALLVSSFEPHDYKAVFLSFQYVIEGLASIHKIDKDKHAEAFADSFRFIFNKAKNVADSVGEIDIMLHNISGLSPDLTKVIHDHEKDFGPQLAPLIEGFDMGDICTNAENFVSQPRTSTPHSEWGKWLETIACRARLIKAQDIQADGKAQ